MENNTSTIILCNILSIRSLKYMYNGSHHTILCVLYTNVTVTLKARLREHLTNVLALLCCSFVCLLV